MTSPAISQGLLQLRLWNSGLLLSHSVGQGQSRGQPGCKGVGIEPQPLDRRSGSFILRRCMWIQESVTHWGPYYNVFPQLTFPTG